VTPICEAVNWLHYLLIAVEQLEVHDRVEHGLGKTKFPGTGFTLLHVRHELLLLSQSQVTIEVTIDL
jgi:hypothetical protein